ncbi:anti-sigma factor [Duganella sp. FT134W]|uniref:Anti-sigma factor n=1 Tax=Duganella margarita TaxID=2692170 RepID=A0A7X4KGR0_9BURK|nr:anti-sigma factor [Duganella margarita]MYM73746.1 anti-sigma factor [Duganella margarita]
MSQMSVTEAELHAYVDGVLPAARMAEIDAYLIARPEEAARIAAYATQNDELRRLFDPVRDEVPPAAMLTRPQAGRQRQPWLRAAAMVVIALTGAVAGWELHGTVAPAQMQARVADDAAPMLASASAGALAQRAAVAHAVYTPDMRRPVEIGAQQEDQLVTWLSKRLGSDIRPAHLGKLGYELIGGRLLPGDSGPVAQFMYQDQAGRRLTLYVSNDQTHNQDTGFRFAREGRVNVFYWIDGKFGYALSASADKGELARVAAAVYEQLDKPESRP